MRLGGSTSGALCLVLLLVVLPTSRAWFWQDSAEEGCSDTEFECTDGECIEEELKCDGTADCSDGLDETECNGQGQGGGTVYCSDTEFRCWVGTPNCIDTRRLCDGYADCSDNSDESDCHTEPGALDYEDELDYDDNHCFGDEFQCGDGSCIDEGRTCDGYSDCDDQSDENLDRCNNGGDNYNMAAPCFGDEFQCGDGACINERATCDGHPDCSDRSDETLDRCTMGGGACSSSEFTCDDDSCIDVRRKCDGYPDCPDSSDESPTNPECDSDRCADSEYTCEDGECIDLSLRCNGRPDCWDSSDELDCACASNEFQCQNGECINALSRCNNQPDCYDGSDEEACPGDACSPTEFLCDSGECINALLKCNAAYDCRDGSDETKDCNTPTRCTGQQLQCRNGDCIDLRLKCDGRRDCQDGYDEAECPVGCTPDQFSCANGDCVSGGAKCNGRPECSDGSDERGCPPVGPEPKCEWYMMSCGGQCIDRRRMCDGNRDCPAGEDEPADCATRTCQPLQFECSSGDCIDLRQECDGHPDCGDGSDEGASCQGGAATKAPCTSDKFVCGDGKCLEPYQRCDGAVQCNDGSDENNCPGVPTQPPSLCSQYEYLCRDGSCIDDRRVCDGRPDCPDGSDETDPDRCQIEPPTDQCSPAEFQCADGSCIDVRRKCDDYPDCRDQSDESSSTCGGGPEPPTTTCSASEFECGDRSCIDIRRKCDDYPDCRDQSDESSSNCGSAPVPPCAGSEFSCGDGSCIDSRRVCDQYQDCSDGSDEAQNCDGDRGEQDVDVCVMPSETGNCRAAIPKWYFDSAAGQCQQFIYGGCGGNGNKFDSQQECQNRCNPGGVDACMMPGGETGNCRAAIPKWYFDSAAGQCRQFIYGGCGGNGNNFDSQQECQNSCSSGSGKSGGGPQPGSCASGEFAAGHGLGCLTCWCNEMAQQCSPSMHYWGVVKPDYFSSAFMITTRSLYDEKSAGFELDGAADEVIFSFREAGLENDQQRWFFKLPQEFLGNQVDSYGGNLTFSISLSVPVDDNPSNRDVDIEIIGGGERFYYMMSDPPAGAYHMDKFSIPMLESAFSKADGSRPDRATFLKVLANIETFLIRASYHSIMGSTTLGQLRLSKAVDMPVQGLPRTMATTVETCQCPGDYVGTSCTTQSWGPPVPTRQPGGQGVPEIMLEVRKVTQAVGADITISITISGSGPFEVTWSRKDGQPLRSGITVQGDYSLHITNLQDSDAGIYIITVVNSYGTARAEISVEVLGVGNMLKVIVQDPKIKMSNVGDSVTLKCIGISSVTYTLAWTKQDGDIPWERSEDHGDGVLTIKNLQASDAGKYECIGSNFYSIDTDVGEIQIGGGGGGVRPPPGPQCQSYEFKCRADGNCIDARRKCDSYDDCRDRSDEAGCPGTGGGGGGGVEVNVGNSEVTVTEGSDLRLDCSVRSADVGIVDVRWSLPGGLPTGAYQTDGVLTVPNVQQQMAGRYECTVTVQGGISGTGYATVIVTRGPGGSPLCSQYEFECANRMCIDSRRTCDDYDDCGDGSDESAGAGCAVNIPLCEPSREWQCGTGECIDARRKCDGRDDCRDRSDETQECGDVGSGSECQRQKSEADSHPRPGQFTPQCRDDGSWHELQCHGSTAYCWCVDAQGGEIGGSRVQFEQPDCSAHRGGHTGGHSGGHSGSHSGGHSGGHLGGHMGGNAGSHTPAYLSVSGYESCLWQRTPSDSHSEWCMPASMPQQCAQHTYQELRRVFNGDNCPGMLGSSAGSLPPAYLTIAGYQTCLLQHNHSPSTGSHTEYCLPGTMPQSCQYHTYEELRRVFIGSDCPDVGSGSECQRQKAEADSQSQQGMVGQFTPRCRDDGSWHELQCHGSTGYCWCADAQGGEIGGSRIRFEQPDCSAQPGGGSVGGIEVNVGNSEVSVVEGASLRLDCAIRAGGSSGVLEVRWTREGGVMPYDSYQDNGVLTVPSVTIADAGRYECTVTVEGGISGSGFATVRVTPGGVGSSCQQGDWQCGSGECIDERRKCDGYPDCGDGSDEICGEAEECRQGEFQCGSGECIDARRKCDQYPDCTDNSDEAGCTGTGGGGTGGIAQSAPVITLDPERQTVGTGSTAVITCQTTGNPTPTITWTRVSGELPASAQVDGATLRLVNVAMEDRGLYVCDAMSSAGQARAGAVLEVERRELPVVEIYPEPTVTVQQGGSTLFQCRVTGGSPPPTIEWSRANNAVMTSNTEIMAESGVVRLNGITAAEAGAYICTAKNEVGSATATATVNLEGSL